jgi:hypothetical protein
LGQLLAVGSSDWSMSHVTEKNQSNVDVEQYQLRTDNKNTQKKLLIGTFLLSFVLANYQLRD